VARVCPRREAGPDIAKEKTSTQHHQLNFPLEGTVLLVRVAPGRPPTVISKARAFPPARHPSSNVKCCNQQYYLEEHFIHSNSLPSSFPRPEGPQNKADYLQLIIHSLDVGWPSIAHHKIILISYRSEHTADEESQKPTSPLIHRSRTVIQLFHPFLVLSICHISPFKK
jgi:hypothetical protein